VKRQTNPGPSVILSAAKDLLLFLGHGGGSRFFVAALLRMTGGGFLEFTFYVLRVE